MDRHAPEGRWAFPDRPDTTAFTTKRVAVEVAAIVFVFHDRDGTWQFIDSEPWVRADVVVSHLGHLIDQDPTLVDLADLPIGSEASRDGPDAPWTRRPMPPAEDDPGGERRRRRWPWQRRQS